MTAQIEKKEIGNLLLEGIPDIPGQINERLAQYQDAREAVLIDWLPEGDGLLLFTRFGESMQVHRLEHPDGSRRQITFFEEPVFNAKVCPQPGSFTFFKDTGGSEDYQLFHFDLHTGHCRQLTDGKARNDHSVWDTAGQRVFFCSNRRNRRDHDIYVCTPSQSHEGAKLLLRTKGYWYPLACSPNDRLLLLEEFVSSAHIRLHVLDMHTGRLLPLQPQGDGVAETIARQAVWSADGAGFYYITDLGREFAYLAYQPLTGAPPVVLTPDMDWDVELLSLSRDGRCLAFAANENGTSRLYCLDTATGCYTAVPHLPMGQVKGMKWHPRANRLALTLTTPTTPADIFVYDFDTTALTRWTRSEVGGLNPDHFVMPTLVHYPTFDEVDGHRRLIPAYYYRPAKAKGPCPVLIFIHGGPESQFRPEFIATFQYYLNELGIAIVAPNVRGSTGYGKSFLLLDNGYKREDSVRDIGALLDWVATQPGLDTQRVAVIGGSYGGYMVLASMTHYNERLRCGIDVVGISNFVTFLRHTKAYRRDLRRVEYGDERDPAMRHHLERISPTNNAHKITKPMLIVQGMNDPRVPASEAEQMLRAIRSNGGEAWYLLAKDEGHGFRKKSNRDYYNKAVILFLQKYLLETAG